MARATSIPVRGHDLPAHAASEPCPYCVAVGEFVETQNGYVESFNGRMRDELLNESLVFGLDHARSAIAEWRQDFNTTRPHSSLDYQTPAAFAGTLTATGSDAALIDGIASLPVAQPAPYGVTETAETLIAAG